MDARWRPLLLAALLAAGCVPVYSQGVATGPRLAPHAGPVVLSGTQVPAGATEVGELQAVGSSTIVELLPELVRRTAELGGNHAYIDSIATTFQMVARPYTYSYRCGYRGLSTCFGHGIRHDEVPTTVITGRAYRVTGTAP